MYVRNSSKKRKYLIVKLFGTRSCDGSLYVCSCRYNGCINRRDVHNREAAYILGIKIYRDRQRRLVALSQSTYLDKVLKRFRMDKAKKGSLPMLSGKILSKAQCPATVN